MSHPLLFFGYVFHETPVFISTHDLMYLTILGLVQHPVWGFLDVEWMSLGG